jgi:hypothetical protein
LAFVNGPSQGDEQRNVIAIAVHSDAGNAIHGLEFNVNAPILLRFGESIRAELNAAIRRPQFGAEQGWRRVVKTETGT